MDSSLYAMHVPQNSKRKRKSDDPSSYMTKGKNTSSTYCKNLACKAIMREEDLFCKRCSCCICHKYDDNKVTRRWLTCSSDLPFSNESCGLTCHLECAFKSDKSGIKDDKPINDVDGCFYCVSCGKTNSLLECLKKHLETASESRRVGELGDCLVIAQKLLKGTNKYIKLFETVEEAVKALETDLSCSLTSIPEDMHQFLVSRRELAKKAKELCSDAFTFLKKTLVDDLALHSKRSGSTEIKFDKAMSSKTDQIGRGTDIDVRQLEKTISGYKQNVAVLENLPNALEINDRPEKAIIKGGNSRNTDFGFVDCMQAIRDLECAGHLESNFRMKFFTWYGIKATDVQKKLVKYLIDILKGDPKALAGQLVDSFSEFIFRG